MKIQDVKILHTQEEFIESTLTLIEQSTRYIRIRSSMLDKSLFNQPEVITALSKFVRASRYREIRILVDFPEQILKAGHLLLELNRRMSQKIIIKEFYDEKSEHLDSLILTDTKGLLIKPPQTNQEGLFSSSDVIQRKHFENAFDHEWLQSKVADNIRTLSI